MTDTEGTSDTGADQSIVKEAGHKASKAFAERMEYELRGAWRAGYDYVHVYQDPASYGPQDGVKESLTVHRYVLPSKTAERPSPDGLTYIHTYDLTSVPDNVLRDALRGDHSDVSGRY